MNNNEEEFIKRVAQSTFDRLMRSQPHFDKVVELIKSQSKPEEEQQRWVSVKSGELPQKDLRLPSVSDVVLVVPLNTMSTMGYYDFGLKLWYTTSSKRIIVTHWMPLPPPPITPKEGSQTKEEKQ